MIIHFFSNKQTNVINLYIIINRKPKISVKASLMAQERVSQRKNNLVVQIFHLLHLLLDGCGILFLGAKNFLFKSVKIHYVPFSLKLFGDKTIFFSHFLHQFDVLRLSLVLHIGHFVLQTFLKLFFKIFSVITILFVEIQCFKLNNIFLEVEVDVQRIVRVFDYQFRS